MGELTDDIIDGLSPPHYFKQKTVIYYAKKYNINTFIETGTYLGDMVNAVRNIFSKIYTIELDAKLYRRAKDRLQQETNIIIYQGDSTIVLPHILNGIDERSLFWLDAHYSSGITAKGNKDTPILEELNCILNHYIKNHIILIDDARMFIGKNDYPTIDELLKFIENKNSKFSCKINDDIIRIM